MPDEYDKYEMVYCDFFSCRVNTFEYGRNGRCPSCNSVGKEIPHD